MIYLSPPDRDLLLRLARGATAQDLARDLNLSTAGVHSRKTRLFARLGATNAAHAVQIGYQEGLLESNPAASRARLGLELQEIRDQLALLTQRLADAQRAFASDAQAAA